MLQLRLTEELNVALMLISEKILLLVVHTYDISVTNKPANLNTILFLKLHCSHLCLKNTYR